MAMHDDQVRRLAHLSANWSPVEVLHRQVLSTLQSEGHVVAPGSPSLPDAVVGALAVRLSRIFPSYHEREEQFISDALAIMGSSLDDIAPRKRFTSLYSDKRFTSLPTYSGDDKARRRPTPFEAIVETSRRNRDIRAICEAFEKSRIPNAALLGGSMSYGRFFNVRGTQGNESGSDVDILLVLPSFKDISNVHNTLRKVPFISREDISHMKSRASTFEKLVKEFDRNIVFSQKVTCWDTSKYSDSVYPKNSKIDPKYHISFHIVSEYCFETLVSARRNYLEDDAHDTIFDYRTTLPARGIAKGFDGIAEHFDHVITEVDDEYIAEFRTFDTYGSRYKPGLHQQLILPKFDERWANRRHITLPLAAFRTKLLERLRLERRTNPHAVQSLSLTHIRYPFFAPHVRRKTDALELEY